VRIPAPRDAPKENSAESSGQAQALSSQLMDIGLSVEVFSITL